MSAGPAIGMISDIGAAISRRATASGTSWLSEPGRVLQFGLKDRESLKDWQSLRGEKRAPDPKTERPGSGAKCPLIRYLPTLSRLSPSWSAPRERCTEWVAAMCMGPRHTAQKRILVLALADLGRHLAAWTYGQGALRSLAGSCSAGCRGLARSSARKGSGHRIGGPPQASGAKRPLVRNLPTLSRLSPRSAQRIDCTKRVAAMRTGIFRQGLARRAR